jgi:hypothetical protein
VIVGLERAATGTTVAVVRQAAPPVDAGTVDATTLGRVTVGGVTVGSVIAGGVTAGIVTVGGDRPIQELLSHARSASALDLDPAPCAYAETETEAAAGLGADGRRSAVAVAVAVPDAWLDRGLSGARERERLRREILDAVAPPPAPVAPAAAATPLAPGATAAPADAAASVAIVAVVGRTTALAAAYAASLADRDGDGDGDADSDARKRCVLVCDADAIGTVTYEIDVVERVARATLSTTSISRDRVTVRPGRVVLIENGPGAALERILALAGLDSAAPRDQAGLVGAMRSQGSRAALALPRARALPRYRETPVYRWRGAAGTVTTVTAGAVLDGAAPALAALDAAVAEVLGGTRPDGGLQGRVLDVVIADALSRSPLAEAAVRAAVEQHAVATHAAAGHGAAGRATTPPVVMDGGAAARGAALIAAGRVRVEDPYAATVALPVHRLRAGRTQLGRIILARAGDPRGAGEPAGPAAAPLTVEVVQRGARPPDVEIDGIQSAPPEATPSETVPPGRYTVAYWPNRKDAGVVALRPIGGDEPLLHSLGPLPAAKAAAPDGRGTR